MSKIVYTTSFNKTLLEGYGHKTIIPILKDLTSNNQNILVWVDSEEDFQYFQTQGHDFNGRVGTLDHMDQYKFFMTTFGDNAPFKARGTDYDKIPNGHKFKFNYIPFSKKSFSWIFTYHELEEDDIMVWLDADLQHKNKIISDDQVRELLADKQIAFLDRDFPWYSIETGFFIIKKCKEMDDFVNVYFQALMTGFVFDLSEWHDGYWFKAILKLVYKKTTEMVCLTPTENLKDRDVLEVSPVSEFFTHLKGPLKYTNQSTNKSIFIEPETIISFNPEEQ